MHGQTPTRTTTTPLVNVRAAEAARAAAAAIERGAPGADVMGPAPEAAAAVPPPPQPIQEPGRDDEPGCLRSLFSCCLPCLPRPTASAAAASARVAPAQPPTELEGARPLRLRVVALGSAPEAVTREVTRLVRANRFQDAGRVFADAALGPRSTPEQCCALMHWLNGMWAHEGEFGAMFLRALPTKELMQKAFGQAGAKVLSEGGRSGTAHLEAVARFAAAYECQGFPRLSALDGAGCGYSYNSDLRESRRAEDVLQWWIGSLLAQLPTQNYRLDLIGGPVTDWPPPGYSLSQMADLLAHRPAQSDSYVRELRGVRRPAHPPLVALLQHEGGHSLPAAMLCLWAASFGRNDRDQRGPIEPDYLNRGIARNRQAQAEFLGKVAQGFSETRMPRQPLQTVVFCLASGLSGSQFYDATSRNLQTQMRRILQHAFQDSPALASEVRNVLTQRAGLAGLPPDVAPYAVLAGTETTEDKQDRVTAWFTEVIGRLTPEVFGDQRRRLVRMLEQRESEARAAIAPFPARPDPESKASHSARSARSASAAASLDDQVADDALIDRHTALPMLYASYRETLKTLLHMVEPSGRRGDARATRRPERHLLRALATPTLRRHAGIVEQEQAWLSTWRQDRHAEALGADLIEATLRQLKSQLNEVLGRPAAPGPAPAGAPAIAARGAPSRSAGLSAEAKSSPLLRSPSPRESGAELASMRRGRVRATPQAPRAPRAPEASYESATPAASSSASSSSAAAARATDRATRSSATPGSAARK